MLYRLFKYSLAKILMFSLENSLELQGIICFWLISFFPSPHPYHDMNWQGRIWQIEEEHTNVSVIDLMCCFFTLWLTQFGETCIHWLFDSSDNLLYYCIKYVQEILNAFLSASRNYTLQVVVVVAIHNKYWYSQKNKIKCIKGSRRICISSPCPYLLMKGSSPVPCHCHHCGCGWVRQWWWWWWWWWLYTANILA